MLSCVSAVFSGPMLLLLARFSQLFQKFVQSLESPNFIRKFLNKFIAPQV